MKLFVTVYNDARLLRHFLDHYTAAGVTEFLIAAAPELKDIVQEQKGCYKITVFEGLDVRDISSATAVSHMRTLHQQNGEWVVVVDLDEFIELPENVQSMAARADHAGATVIRGIMHDRFCLDGQLADVRETSDLSALCPVKSRFVRDVMHGCDHKGVLVKGHLKPSDGAIHHRFDEEVVHTEIFEISHYKWITGSLDRLRTSHRILAAAGVPWSVEYKRALDHYDAYDRFAWETFGGGPIGHFEMEAPDRCRVCEAPISAGEYAYSTRRCGQPLCRFHQNQLVSQG
jgi:hypothetical protein